MENLEKITWSNDFSVGNNDLDAQHLKIVNFINDLIDMPSFKNQAQALDCITKMLAYSIEHLDYEEQLLQELGYPEADSHSFIHQFYVSKVKNLLKSSFHNDEMFKHEILDFLKEWWTYHILEEDMKYKPFLQSKGLL
jgi:hemerythrin